MALRPPPVIRRLARPVVRALTFDEVRLVHAMFRADQPGAMVDVGAHFGGSLEPFVRSGWTVVAFEPDPHNRERLEDLVGTHPRVTIDPRAVSDVDGSLVELFTSEVSSGITTLAPFHETHVPTVKVETVRLDTALARLDVKAVRFLKVDVEGYDLHALRTFPWERMVPEAVVCEFEDAKTVPLGHRMEDIADFLVDKGYAVFVSEWYPVVEYGRRHRWRSMTRYPAALADPDSWGNLVAVRPDRASEIDALVRTSPARLSPLRRRPPRRRPGRSSHL